MRLSSVKTIFVCPPQTVLRLDQVWLHPLSLWGAGRHIWSRNTRRNVLLVAQGLKSVPSKCSRWLHEMEHRKIRRMNIIIPTSGKPCVLMSLGWLYTNTSQFSLLLRSIFSVCSIHRRQEVVVLIFTTVHRHSLGNQCLYVMELKMQLLSVSTSRPQFVRVEELVLIVNCRSERWSDSWCWWCVLIRISLHHQEGNALVLVLQEPFGL